MPAVSRSRPRGTPVLRQSLRIPALAAACGAMVVSGTATPHAAETALVVTEAHRSTQRASAPLPAEVRRYDPLPVTEAIRNAGEAVNLYLDGVVPW